MLNKQVVSRLGVVAACGVLGSVIACGSSSGGGGFPSSTASSSSGGSSSGSTGYTGSSSSGYSTSSSSGNTGYSSSGGTTTSSGGTTTSSGGTTTSSGGTTSSSGGGTSCYSGSDTGAITAMTMGTMGNGGWYNITGLGSGYAFSYNDGTASNNMCTTSTSTACNDPNALCVSGTTGVMDGAPNYYCWGAGFGVNVGQMMGSMTNTPISVTGKTGIQYALSGFSAVTGGMRITVKDGSGNSYCANLTAASGMVPFTSLTEQCYNMPPGTAFSASSTIADVEFTIESSTSAVDYNVCATTLQFY